MCSRYSNNKDEAKLRLRDKILVYGALPRANIRPPFALARQVCPGHIFEIKRWRY